MLSKLGLTGMGAGFLMISPVLRADVSRGIEFTVTQIMHYSPYSYVMLGLAFLAAARMALNTNPRPQ